MRVWRGADAGATNPSLASTHFGMELQLRVVSVSMLTLAINNGILFFVRPYSCRSYMLDAFGALPGQARPCPRPRRMARPSPYSISHSHTDQAFERHFYVTEHLSAAVERFAWLRLLAGGRAAKPC